MELVPALVSKPAHYTWQKKEHGIYRTVTEVYLPNFRFLALCSVANAVAVFPKKKPDCQRPNHRLPGSAIDFSYSKCLQRYGDACWQTHSNLQIGSTTEFGLLLNLCCCP